jgi:hypothetical protein
MIPRYTPKGVRIAMKPLNIFGQVFIRGTFEWRLQAILEHGRWRNFCLVDTDAFMFPTAIPASPLGIDLKLVHGKWLLK